MKTEKVLTRKQEAFCQHLVFDKDEKGFPISQAEAYRRSFNAENMKPETVSVKASNLSNEDKIRVRVEELKREVSAKMARETALTIEEHMRDLKWLRDCAVEAKQFGPAVTAETNRGKLMNFYVEKVKQEVSGPEGAPLITAIEIELVRPKRND